MNNHLSDPKLYVYLMQQIGRDAEIKEVNQKLIDTLVLYALRDTDPDRDEFLNMAQVCDGIRSFLNFDFERLDSKVRKRLSVLTKKPRRVNHHGTIDSYCLPYETRLEIIANNAKDQFLYDTFHSEMNEVLSKNLKIENVSVSNLSSIIDSMLEKIYYKQGLDFSDFLLNGGEDENFDCNLNEVATEIIEESTVINKNKTKVKDVIIITIREIVYHGSLDAKKYLSALSKTYLMLFLLKCEPKIVDYFHSMAANLELFVCNSILVPAFSEICLEPQNQRYWGLLKAAKSRGVKMLVTDSIINELEHHINRSKYIYDQYYKDYIDKYEGGGEDLIDQILVRAFLYAKKEGKVHNYNQFIDKFITVGGINNRQELIDFLHIEFGIEYVSEEDLGLDVDEEDMNRLVNELKGHKKSVEKARADAILVLSIYAIRKRNGEDKSSIYGYKTWWLSSDTTTHRAVVNVFKSKYPVSCYMRPDFLYNYISFTPTKEGVEEVYKNTFPNLLGVQISNHISPEIAGAVRESIKEHADKIYGRKMGQIRNMVDELKSNPDLDYQNKLKSFFN